jgi:hypothetical protein
VEPTLDRSKARIVIERLGSSGQPPEYGFQFFTAGLTPYLDVLREDYLRTYVADGGSAFKLALGVYGGGKTHFLFCVRDHAWTEDFATSYVSLSSGASPFHRLELVYGAIVRGLVAPMTPDELLSDYERGVGAFIDRWYARKYKESDQLGIEADGRRAFFEDELESLEAIENISFRRAVIAAFRARLDKREVDFADICQWLSGEGYVAATHRKFGILQKIDRTTAFSMIRSLVQWIRAIDYKGLVVLLDEAERVPSLSTRQRDQHLNNLREIIDECGQSSFKGMLMIYAVPDDSFLEGRTQVYEALRQRLATTFQEINPAGVRIELDELVEDPVPFLTEIGMKIADVYTIAYDHPFDDGRRAATINLVADWAYEQRFADTGYKRLFVTNLVKSLHYLRAKDEVPPASLLGT